MKTNLLNRDNFREQVFLRDNYCCVICGKKAQDAHHIIERRLFDDGGYYLDNGASLCGEHHILAEQTVLSCDEIRKAANIVTIILPDHLYDDYTYDKWGNIVGQYGNRLRGELFYDESVQKILKEGKVLGLFADYKVKHPRTHHLPWSENVTKDDKLIKTMDRFIGNEIVITEKMDGEQTSMYWTGYCHARSMDSEGDFTRSWVKNLCNQIYYNIPEGWRICGENVAYKHSIFYPNLETYFFVHSIWNEKNICLSWEDTVLYSELFGLKTVPLLFKGKYEDFNPDGFFQSTIDGRESEGYVMRVANEFNFSQFKNCVAKYVRKNHVQTVQHWRHGSQLIENILKN